jgi:N-glycosylase/DNA lyase
LGEQAEASLVREHAVHGDIPAGAGLARAGRMSLGVVPPGFSLRRTAMSHGWCALAPTAYDGTRAVLHRTLDLPDAGPLTVSVRQRPTGALEASWGRTHGSCDDRIAIKEQCRRMLTLDDDLTQLYAACAPVESLQWVQATGSGRLLRSPTVWEDLVKTLTTTNCSWALTTSMCRRLVDVLGAQGPAGERAFPSPAALAAAGEEVLRTEIRAGYRARAFVDLGAAVASGAVDPERWLASGPHARAHAEVLDEIRSLRGFGPYASEGMLGLLGRPRGFALDSWVRAKLPQLLGVAAMTDDEIRARYTAYGDWAGSVLWLELTRDWFGD